MNTNVYNALLDNTATINDPDLHCTGTDPICHTVLIPQATAEGRNQGMANLQVTKTTGVP